MTGKKPNPSPANRRLAADLYVCPNRVSFMTIRAFNHQTPFVEAGLNQLVLDVLREEQERQNCAVFTYCLMPDHLHFLVSPLAEGISVLRFAEGFKGKATNRSWKLGWRGKLWQPRFYDHIVRAQEDLCGIAQYILDNPVRRGLSARPEAWPWSGHMNPLP
ncbi:MAG: transposase [Syntrophobacteraceae bacterium]